MEKGKINPGRKLDNQIQLISSHEKRITSDFIISMRVKRLTAAYKFLVPIVKGTLWYVLRKLLCFFTLSAFIQINVFWIARVIGLYIASIESVLLLWKWLRSKNRRHFWVPETKSLPPGFLVSSSIGRHRYTQLKDVKLHYVECGNSKKPLLLCLHGFTEVWYSWRHQLKTFSKDYW